VDEKGNSAKSIPAEALINHGAKSAPAVFQKVPCIRWRLISSK
jgi:hypothetical protein